MVEKDITVKIKLEVDEGSKQAVRNQAQAIRETGDAPVQRETEDTGFGIFKGERIDPEIKGFQKRKTNIRTPFKDKSSKAAFQRNSSFAELANRVDGIENTISTPEQLQSLLGVNPTDFKQLINIGRNPADAILSLGRTIPIISAILASPEFINQFINILIAPGGPFDKRIKIILEQQQEQFLSREAQKRRELGLDQVVISQTGFTNANGRLTVNTLNQVKNAGTSDIGLNEISIGMRG